tara:strand:- start:273 stop:719 length:447 start_codon:yes stop_codon:yes gene_type:complete
LSPFFVKTLIFVIKKTFLFWIKKLFSEYKKLLTCINQDYNGFIHKIIRIQLSSIVFIYFFIHLNPLEALEAKDYLIIDDLVKSCYLDTKSCNSALYKINTYQRNAARNKKFSCQTRLLGLEANLIMGMNSNIKINEIKSIIQAMKKYC